MKKTMKRALSLFLAMMLLLALSACGGSKGSSNTAEPGSTNTAEPGSTGPAEEPEFTLKLVSHQMVGTSRYEATVVPFCESVKAASNGRLVIEPYGAGVLFPVTDSFTNLQNGVIDLMACWDGNWSNLDPCFALAADILCDPIVNFSEHYYRSDALDEVMADLYSSFGLTYLGGFDYGAPEIFMSNKEIRTLDDFKGMNIRTAGMAATFYSALGASPVSLASTEIYTAMQLGTVDGAEYNDWLVNGEMALDEVSKYVIEPCFHQRGGINDKSLIANTDTWNSLPDDLKAIVLTCMKEARYNSAVAYDVGSSLAKKEWIESGVEVIELPPEEIAKAEEISVDIINDYKAKGGFSERYVDIYKQVLLDLGYDDFASKIN